MGRECVEAAPQRRRVERFDRGAPLYPVGVKPVGVTEGMDYQPEAAALRWLHASLIWKRSPR
jgi:hypothetical protein